MSDYSDNDAEEHIASSEGLSSDNSAEGKRSSEDDNLAIMTSSDSDKSDKDK